MHKGRGLVSKVQSRKAAHGIKLEEGEKKKLAGKGTKKGGKGSEEKVF